MNKGGLLVKVVFAATTEQEEQIEALVDKMFHHVLPHYFSEKELQTFGDMNILKPTEKCMETLGDAYSVLASLQTLMHLLEDAGLKKEHCELFKRNTEILNRFDISFPFSFHHFLPEQTKEPINIDQAYLQ